MKQEIQLSEHFGYKKLARFTIPSILMMIVTSVYGVVDGKDPIVRPSATATFGDWVYLSAEAIFDLTKGSGKRGGYGNRAGKYSALYPSIGLAHEFELGEQIGTLGVDFGYQYWYTPRSIGEVWDTQYLYLELTLEGHWIEPTLYVERDIMADEGTYVNLALAHTFETCIEGLSVTPSIVKRGNLVTPNSKSKLHCSAILTVFESV